MNKDDINQYLFSAIDKSGLEIPQELLYNPPTVTRYYHDPQDREEILTLEFGVQHQPNYPYCLIYKEIDGAKHFFTEDEYGRTDYDDSPGWKIDLASPTSLRHAIPNSIYHPFIGIFKTALDSLPL